MSKEFNENPQFTKMEDLCENGFKVERDQHLESNIDPMKKFQELANIINWIINAITQAKNMQLWVLQNIAVYNAWVDIMNNAKKELWLTYKELKKVNEKDFENIVDCDIEKLPKIDIHKEVEKESE